MTGSAASPESITTIVSMDSGPAPRGTSRNDDGLICADPRNHRRQLPHIVECQGSTRGAQCVGVARPAVAAAVETERGHAGGARGGDAGDAVLDHHASRG